jgi:DNA-binding transcriptional LysR family regulator
MADLDVTLLRSFLAVARCGSFSAAARDLGYTQSAVSQQVAALESDLGVTLLRRRPVALTEAGRRLVEHAQPILLRLRAARADVRRLSGAQTARVLVGASPLADPRFAAAALVAVQRSLPRVDFVLRIAGRDHLATAVAEGELDLALVDGVTVASDPLRLPDSGPLTTTTLTEEPVAVALPVGHPFASRTSLRLSELADARWIDASDVATPLPHLRVIAHADGFRPSMRYAGTEIRMLLSLVAAGGGLVLLPGSALTGSGCAGVALSEPRLVHRTELVHGSLAEAAAVLATAVTGSADRRG